MTCVRAKCFHSHTEHEEETGACVAMLPSGEMCECEGFCTSRETVVVTRDASEDPLGSDERVNTPENAPATIAHDVIKVEPTATPQANVVRRRYMSETRPAKTRAFSLMQTTDAGVVERVKLYFTVGFFEDGGIGEIFIKADRQGSLTSGALDAVGIFASMMLQYGVPIAEVIDKLRGMRFPPAGRVVIERGGESVYATSPLDLLARWLQTFMPREAP